MDAVDPGGLGGTFGGNPVSCAAANVVLDAVPGMRARVRGAGRAAARRAGGHRRRAWTRSARCAGSARCSRSRSCATASPRRRRPSCVARRDRRGARGGPAPARLRPARQRDPAAAAADDLRRRPDPRARDPRSFARREMHPARPPLRRRVPAGGRDPAPRPRRRRALALRLDRAAASRRRGSSAPAREAIVVCWNRDGGAAYRAVVSLRDDADAVVGGPARASSPTSRPTSGTSATPRCAHEPRLIEALAKRGITDMDKVLIDVWGYRGFLAPGALRRGGAWAGRTPGSAQQPGSNPYANPVNGLHCVVDLNTMELLEIEDTFAVDQPPGSMGEYVPRFVPGPAAARRPASRSRSRSPTASRSRSTATR